jgi:hypothetical protein
VAVDKKNIISWVLAILLLGLAAVLRLYHLLSIPYTYDEFSTLFRTHFNSFSELIDKGVVVDVHPAGIQVFEYYWVKLFGYAELVVKMPFIVWGVLAVLYVFMIGKEWFNSTAGLVAAAFIATLQYTVMYSQIARPYMSGVFFSLAMVYHWNKVVFKPGKRYDLHWILYVLFASCCSYNHHFSLLFAGIVGLTGIFFVNRRYIVRYIAGGIMIFVLYIPHLHIFFYQLSKGGVESWLGKPHNDFILTYLKFAFQFSYFVYGAVAAIGLIGLGYRIWTRQFPNKYFFIALIWFLIPIVAGFFYSRYINAVLQYSGLLFSFPFLLLAIAGLMPELHWSLKTTLIAGICAVNVYALVYQRKYYDIFYKAPFENNAILTDSVQRAIGKSNVLALADMNASVYLIEKYYADKYKLDTSLSGIDTISDRVPFIDFLEDHPRQYLSYATISQTDPDNIAIIMNYYPNLIKKYDFYNGTFYIFSNTEKPKDYLYSYQEVNDFKKPASGPWQYDEAMRVDSVHESGTHSIKQDSLHEWGPTYTNDLSKISYANTNIVMVSADVYPLGNMDDVMLVSELQSGGKTIDWRATPISDFIMIGTRKHWVKVYHSIKLQDIYLKYPDIKVKTYFWNKGKRNFFIDDFAVRTMKGNPIVYSLFQKL